MRPLVQMILVLQLLLALPVEAGQRCDSTPPTAAQMQDGLALASQLQQRLDALGAQVAVVGRAGEDVRRHGLRYTHAGLMYRSAPGEPWRVLHKLNHCGTDKGALYRQGLGNFFLDTPFEYRAWIAVLKPEPAAALLAAIAEGRQEEVHQPHYSLLGYPFGLTAQNSNGWLLEFLALTTTRPAPYGRAAVQTSLRRTGYEPGMISVSPLERVGAGFARSNVGFMDHPLRERLEGRYSVVTVDSIVHWARRQGLLATTEEIALP